MIRNATIDARDLTRVFGKQIAVNRINLSVYPGEIFGFLGANGAGKTTAIRMLCGLLRPSGGTGHVAGLDIMTQTRQIRGRIGYMSQKFSLYVDLKVRENMLLYGGLYGLSGGKLHEKIKEMSTLLGVEPLWERVTGSLPWGWQQRVSLACANLHEPSVLFLDEPTGSVDPASRSNFWELIRRIAKQGRTVLVTTHHMDEAEYCDRVSIMSEGRIVALGTPRELKETAGCDSLEGVFLKLVQKIKTVRAEP